MNHSRHGFSVIELMIVVALLGLLAAVAIPRISGSPAENPEAGLVEALSALRTGIDSFWAQHDDFPGQGSVDEFTSQLCRRTNATGRPGSGDDFVRGPYLGSGRIPMNPVLGTNTVVIVDTMPGHPVGSAAWIYDRHSGEIHANVHGASVSGVRYFDL
jgi:prepilin-type N-terminal cleavage/methylation domain-containing protein